MKKIYVLLILIIGMLFASCDLLSDLANAFEEESENNQQSRECVADIRITNNGSHTIRSVSIEKSSSAYFTSNLLRGTLLPGRSQRFSVVGNESYSILVTDHSNPLPGSGARAASVVNQYVDCRGIEVLIPNLGGSL